jgi:hypothetical protein
MHGRPDDGPFYQVPEEADANAVPFTFTFHQPHLSFLTYSLTEYPTSFHAANQVSNGKRRQKRASEEWTVRRGAGETARGAAMFQLCVPTT